MAEVRIARKPRGAIHAVLADLALPRVRRADSGNRVASQSNRASLAGGTGIPHNAKRTARPLLRTLGKIPARSSVRTGSRRRHRTQSTAAPQANPALPVPRAILPRSCQTATEPRHTAQRRSAEHVVDACGPCNRRLHASCVETQQAGPAGESLASLSHLRTLHAHRPLANAGSLGTDRKRTGATEGVVAREPRGT